MNYTETLAYIHSAMRLGSRPGLQRITDLLHRLGDPQKQLRCLHVAGTNGKGSTCRMMQAVLTAAGYRCGLYTSPYVIEFRERIQCDGAMIPQEDLARIVTRVREITDPMSPEEKPTEFELITAAAFCWYAEQKVDVLVLEVGLGGRLDATNVIEKPLVSVVTHIDLDHTELLGDTKEAIAAEKGGIIKWGCPVVTGGQTAGVTATLRRIAAERNAPFTEAGTPTDISVSAAGTSFTCRGVSYTVGMPGEHQAVNASLAIEALAASGLSVPDEALRRGLSAAFMPARTEILRRSPLVMLDGSHNPDGVSALAALLTRLSVSGAVGIVGMMADKDIDRALEQVTPYFDHLIAVTVRSNPRSLTAEAMLEKLRGKVKNAYAAPDIASAVTMAAALAEDKPLIIFGSLYLAGEIREPLREFFGQHS